MKWFLRAAMRASITARDPEREVNTTSPPASDRILSRERRFSAEQPTIAGASRRKVWRRAASQGQRSLSGSASPLLILARLAGG